MYDVKTSWQKEESTESVMELKSSHRVRNRIETPEVNIYIASYFSSKTLKHTHCAPSATNGARDTEQALSWAWNLSYGSEFV